MSTNCIPTSGDLKKIRGTGRRMTYLRTIGTYRAAMQMNSQSHSEGCGTYCPIGVEDVSTPLIAPGHALTAMFDFALWCCPRGRRMRLPLVWGLA